MNTPLDTSAIEMITLKEAKMHGLSKYQFYKLVKEKQLKQVIRGIYTPKNSWIDELLLIHKRAPSAVFSHDEAFFIMDWSTESQ